VEVAPLLGQDLMLAAAQGWPNGLAILGNAFVLLGSLYGFYKFAIRGLKSMVADEFMPIVAAHAAADEKQTKATNKVLKKLRKADKRHDASFQIMDERLKRIESSSIK